jgi:hypothetical protein
MRIAKLFLFRCKQVVFFESDESISELFVQIALSFKIELLPFRSLSDLNVEKVVRIFDSKADVLVISVLSVFTLDVRRL